GRPKCTISKFFVEVPGDDGKPKFWNSLDKEIACTFCLKKNNDSFENLEQGKEIVIGKPRYYTQHLLAYLNAPSETDISDTSENPVLSKRLKSNHNEERLENGISKYLLKSPTDKWIKEFQERLLMATISNGWSFHWKNVAKQNIFSITCIIEESEVIIYDARDISSEHSTIEATIKLVKNLLIEDGLKDINIIAIVTDSSSGYAAARRKLRKELLTIIWLPCFAYQANLCIADIFKSLQSFFSAIKQAIVVTTFFNKSPFFTTLLKNICNDFKIPYFALTNPCETRWYSYFNCIRALLKVECALRSLLVTHGASIRIHDKKALALSQAVTSILNDRKFFNDLRILKAILKLFHFSQIFSISETNNQEIQEFKLIMIERLEKHWRD
ncbi:16541_t:CDS:2, partial [Gigaspora margarita]